MPFNGLSPAPKLDRAPFGLETVAKLSPRQGDDSEHWAQGYQQEGYCHYRAVTWSLCMNEGVDPGDPPNPTTVLHNSDADAWFDVNPWFIQAEDLCRDARALRRPEARERLSDVLDSITWKGIERELWTGAHNTAFVTANPGADPNPTFADSAAVTIPVASSPVNALAGVVERLSYLLPGNTGVVHMSPGTAVLLVGQLEVDPDNEPDVMRVKATGNKVVIGQGYADNDSVSNTIVGTGPIVARKGEIKFLTPDLSQGGRVAQNEFTIVAERPVAAAFDTCTLIRATYNV